MPDSPCLHNFNVHVLERGSRGTRLLMMYNCQFNYTFELYGCLYPELVVLQFHSPYPGMVSHAPRAYRYLPVHHGSDH